jgi:hypothetical protein
MYLCLNCLFIHLRLKCQFISLSQVFVRISNVCSYLRLKCLFLSQSQVPVRISVSSICSYLRGKCLFVSLSHRRRYEQTQCVCVCVLMFTLAPADLPVNAHVSVCISSVCSYIKCLFVSQLAVHLSVWQGWAQRPLRVCWCSRSPGQVSGWRARVEDCLGTRVSLASFSLFLPSFRHFCFILQFLLSFWLLSVGTKRNRPRGHLRTSHCFCCRFTYMASVDFYGFVSLFWLSFHFFTFGSLFLLSFRL